MYTGPLVITLHLVCERLLSPLELFVFHNTGIFHLPFIPLVVDTTGRVYDEFIRLLFLHAHREVSALVNELAEESDQFRFLRASCFANLKGVVGLIMAKAFVLFPPRSA